MQIPERAARIVLGLSFQVGPYQRSYRRQEGKQQEERRDEVTAD